MTRDDFKQRLYDKRDEKGRVDLLSIYSDIEELFDYIEKPKALAIQVPNNFTNINQEAFNEWMAYKKYKNKGAITKTLNMLNKYDFQTQQQMVDKSIMNEYKGLFEPKQQRTRTDNNVQVAMSWLEEQNERTAIGENGA